MARETQITPLKLARASLRGLGLADETKGYTRADTWKEVSKGKQEGEWEGGRREVTEGAWERGGCLGYECIKCVVGMSVVSACIICCNMYTVCMCVG